MRERHRYGPALVLISALASMGSLRAQTVTSVDLNANAIHDSEEIQLGAQGDCNYNALIDERDAGAPHFAVALEQVNGLEPFQNNVWEAKPIELNQDGRPDLVVTSMFSTNTGAVTLWRNEGGPRLVQVVRLRLEGTRPYSLGVGDLNGDGRSDFVASDASYNRAHVFLATGSETFADPFTLEGPEANNGSVGLTLGDTDNDGDLDVIFTTWYPALVHVFVNDGTAGFTLGTSFAAASEPRDVAVGDFDGDGLRDLVVANEHYSTPTADGTVTLHRNDGDGSFSLHATLAMPRGDAPYHYRAQPQFVELADVDHDGDLDLVTSSKSSNILSIHRNDGAGGFTLAQSFGGFSIESEGRDVLVEDLDGDGWQDLAWGDPKMSIAGIYRNVGGTFEHHQNFASGNYGAFTLAAADFTGDGAPDLVASNETSRTYSILVNRGGLTFDGAPHFRPVAHPDDPVLADFTSDGVTDLALTQTIGSTPHVSVYRGLGGAVFAKTSIDTPISVAGTFQTRDFDHDGRADLISVGGHCVVFLGNGDGTFGPGRSSSLTVNANRHVLTDLNQDGELDLAWLVGGHPSTLYTSLGSGGGWFGPAASWVDRAEDESIGAGDITGDGVPEIFTGHRAGVLSIHTNSGLGTFGARRDLTITGTPLSPKVDAIALADFDRDGDQDVVVSAGGLRRFDNPGDGDLPLQPMTVSSIGASILVPADIDLDGDPDLYGRSMRPVAYMNSDGGAFDALLLPHYDSNARTLVVADANDDGRLDALIGPENSWGEYLYLNLPPMSSDADGSGVPDDCEARCPRRSIGAPAVPSSGPVDLGLGVPAGSCDRPAAAPPSPARPRARRAGR